MLNSLRLPAVALSVGIVVAGFVPSARAGNLDGNWSVVVVTEQGTCDSAYRYNFAVANGQIRYQGDAAVNFNGTVAPNGTVKVTIRVGDEGADGTGRLSKDSGGGAWRGVGNARECAGRWEAERR